MERFQQLESPSSTEAKHEITMIMLKSVCKYIEEQPSAVAITPQSDSSVTWCLFFFFFSPTHATPSTLSPRVIEP